MSQQTIFNITVFEAEEGGYDVAYNYDAMPIHFQERGFDTLEAAKASVPYIAEWREPDEDCRRDVAAWATVSAK